VHLHVPRGNQHAAGFYRHLGFTELPATPDELPAPHLLLFGWTYRPGLSARLQACRIVTCRAVPGTPAARTLNLRIKVIAPRRDAATA
jgi:hypothetical protein